QRIVEHQQLRVEHRRQLGTAAVGDPGADVGQLLAGPGAALAEPRQLVLDPALRDAVAQDLGALDEDDRPAGHHAGRDADAGQALHTPSSKPLSTSPASASTAACSSAPSAEMRIVVPRAAASSSKPMMLFPS